MNAVTNESYPLNLLDEIAEGHWEYPLPEDIKQSLAYVLAELKEREQVVLHAYFCEGKSCGEIAKTAGVVRERIRQIVINALKKLRHPTRMQFLIYGVKGMIHKTSLEATQNTVSIRLEQTLSEIGMASKHLYAVTGQKEYSKISNELIKSNGAIPLERLDLSCRSYQCLKRAGVTTAGDITKMSIVKLMRIRNLGKKSIEEIMSCVHNLGLRLADEDLPEEESFKEEV